MAVDDLQSHVEDILDVLSENSEKEVSREELEKELKKFLEYGVPVDQAKQTLIKKFGGSVAFPSSSSERTLISDLQANKYSVPRIAFMNKMDRTGADFFSGVQSMVDRLGANPVPVQIPIGSEDAFMGPVDLVDMKAVYYEDDSLGAEFEVRDIPDDLKDTAAEYRENLIEALADTDDKIMESFLAGEEIPKEEIKTTFVNGRWEEESHLLEDGDRVGIFSPIGGG